MGGQGSAVEMALVSQFGFGYRLGVGAPAGDDASLSGLAVLLLVTRSLAHLIVLAAVPTNLYHFILIDCWAGLKVSYYFKK